MLKSIPVLSLSLLICQVPVMYAEEKANVVEENTSEIVSPIEIAARLVLQGEVQKSPIMLLAAADLIGAVPEGKRDVSEIKAEKHGGGEADAEKTTPLMSREALEKRALALAATESEKQLVQSWIDRPRPRGLVYEQGKNLPSHVLKGVEYKIIDQGVIGPEQSFTLKNVKFEGQKPARILVIGDGDGDLDLWVHDGNTGGLIGHDEDLLSICEVVWVTKFEGPFTIKVANVGSVAERYFVLANW